MEWIRQLTQSESRRIDAANHQLFEIRKKAMGYVGDPAQHLRDLIAAALLLRALKTDPDDYSGLRIIVETDDQKRFAKKIGDRDRVVVQNLQTEACAGLRLRRLKPGIIDLVRARVAHFARLPKGGAPEPHEVPAAKEIADLRMQAAAFFDAAMPSTVFRDDQALLGNRGSGKKPAYV
jgi:hypothetical protein